MSKANDEFYEKNSLNQLTRSVKHDAVIYSIVRHRARSGMQREISFFTMDETLGKLYSLSFHMAHALGYRLSNGKSYDALVIRGCGFDASQSVVDHLSHKLGLKLRHERL